MQTADSNSSLESLATQAGRPSLHPRLRRRTRTSVYTHVSNTLLSDLPRRLSCIPFPNQLRFVSCRWRRLTLLPVHPLHPHLLPVHLLHPHLLPVAHRSLFPPLVKENRGLRDVNWRVVGCIVTSLRRQCTAVKMPSPNTHKACRVVNFLCARERPHGQVKV